MAFDATVPTTTNQISADITAIRANFEFLIGTANYKLFTNAAGTAPEWAAGFKVLSFTRDMAAASATITYNGFGFKPGAMLVIAAIDTVDLFSIWFTDGTLGAGINQYLTAGAPAMVPSNSIYIQPSAGNTQAGTLDALVADGINIIWVKTGSPTGTLTLKMAASR